MSTADRDRAASNLQQSGMTWVEVATELGLANGGVARRCAMRHRERHGDSDTDTLTITKPEPDHDDDRVPDKVVVVAQNEITINGRTVVPHMEVSIKGESGRFTFRYSLRPDEVTVFGGQPQYEKWRTFKIDRVRTVHRKAKLRKNVEALDTDESGDDDE